MDDWTLIRKGFIILFFFLYAILMTSLDRDIISIWGTIIETLSRVVWVVVVYYEYDPFSLFVVLVCLCGVVIIGGDHHWLQSI